MLCPPQVPEGRPPGRVAEAFPAALVGGDALFERGVVDPLCLSEQEVEFFSCSGVGRSIFGIGSIPD